MEEGVVADRSTNFNVAQTQEWGSTIVWGGFGLKEKKNVKTYRCNTCGYLESYAK